MSLFAGEKPDIEGLTYIPKYITQEQEQFLITQIDAQPWLNALKRRVQHYGYKYDYKARKITPDLKSGQCLIDCIPCFGDTIYSLSLLEPCEMFWREIISSI